MRLGVLLGVLLAIGAEGSVAMSDINTNVFAWSRGFNPTNYHILPDKPRPAVDYLEVAETKLRAARACLEVNALKAAIDYLTEAVEALRKNAEGR